MQHLLKLMNAENIQIEKEGVYAASPANFYS
jgi:hypothetical protein